MIEILAGYTSVAVELLIEQYFVNAISYNDFLTHTSIKVTFLKRCIDTIPDCYLKEQIHNTLGLYEKALITNTYIQ